MDESDYIEFFKFAMTYDKEELLKDRKGSFRMPLSRYRFYYNQTSWTPSSAALGYDDGCC
jgi:hypothetical protein